MASGVSINKVVYTYGYEHVMIGVDVGVSGILGSNITFDDITTFVFCADVHE
tara:strand:+ start:439 stop:594 length:156 start_codon:yes stop_codon:yes gene_type:complete